MWRGGSRSARSVPTWVWAKGEADGGEGREGARELRVGDTVYKRKSAETDKANVKFINSDPVNEDTTGETYKSPLASMDLFVCN